MYSCFESICLSQNCYSIVLLNTVIGSFKRKFRSVKFSVTTLKSINVLYKWTMCYRLHEAVTCHSTKLKSFLLDIDYRYVCYSLYTQYHYSWFVGSVLYSKPISAIQSVHCIFLWHCQWSKTPEELCWHWEIWENCIDHWSTIWWTGRCDCWCNKTTMGVYWHR